MGSGGLLVFGGHVSCIKFSGHVTYASHKEADCEIEFFILYTWQPTHEIATFFFLF